ncbi:MULTISPECIES: YjzD family protein [Bacillus]|uniref:YjzD family protein n=1 Tax=Bacillus TaxID=1386 RepID=UPI00047DE8C6|nr:MULTISPECIES: YjzD family protein [Bacillus]WFA07371.1 YjzD family protein [Bacillus sp. HSf4]
MRFVVTFIWTFLLAHMACYIVGAMNGAAYNFQTSSIMGFIIFAAVIVLGEIMPVKQEASQQ